MYNLPIEERKRKGRICVVLRKLYRKEERGKNLMSKESTAEGENTHSCSKISVKTENKLQVYTGD